MPKDKLKVEKILEDLKKSEQSGSGRKGSFKIDAPFEEAMKKILKAKPESKPSKTKKKLKPNT